MADGPTVTFNFSHSSAAIDMTTFDVQEDTFTGWIPSPLNYDGGPLVYRWYEDDGDGGSSVSQGTILSAVPVYFSPSSESWYDAPGTDKYPVFIGVNDDVFYLLGTLPEMPQVSDYVSSDVYADYDAATAALSALSDAIGDWQEALRGATLDMIQYLDSDVGVDLRVSASVDFTVGDFITEIRGDTLSFHIDPEFLLSQTVDVVGTQYNDTLRGWENTNPITLDGKAGDGDLLVNPDDIDGVIVNLGVTAYTFAQPENIFGNTVPPNQVAASTFIDTYGSTNTVLNIENVEGTATSGDVLIGGAGGGVLWGLGGDDVLASGGDGTEMHGGDDNDVLIGSSGKDTMFGGDGADTLFSWSDNAATDDDTLDGGAGVDTYFVDGFVADYLGESKGNDFISTIEAGETVFFLGDSSPEKWSSVFTGGVQRLRFVDEAGTVSGGFEWGNDAGLDGVTSIKATSTSVDGQAAIQIDFVEEAPSLADAVFNELQSLRQVICTGKTLVDEYYALKNLRADIGRHVENGASRLLGLPKDTPGPWDTFLERLFPDEYDANWTPTVKQHYENLVDIYLDNRISGLKKYIEDAIKNKSVDLLANNYCPEIPSSIIAEIGKLLISPLKVASGVISVGETFSNLIYTYSVIELENAIQAEYDAAPNRIEVIINSEQTLYRVQGTDAIPDGSADTTDTIIWQPTDLLRFEMTPLIDNLVVQPGSGTQQMIDPGAKVGPLQVIGNSLSNIIQGSNLVEKLTGLGGNDRLDGEGGNDNLSGGGGNDLLRGGLGKDVMAGGANRDIFDFDKISESRKGANRDIITDFRHGQHDRIDLRTIDADTVHGGNQAFKFIGSQSFAQYHAKHHNVWGMVRYDHGIVQINVNKGMGADMEIKAIGASHANDFFL